MARTVSKKTGARSAKTVKKATKKKSARPVKKKAEITAKKTATVKKQAEPVETAAQTSEHQGKIQCFNHRKKTICAHLLLAIHKCGVKTIGHGRLATVRIGKKRRCEFYEETAFTA
jgi:hypothetical protein